MCRKVARERNARTVLRFAPKTSHQSNGLGAWTHSGTRTMLPDTNRDEHWHAVFIQFHLPSHLRSVTLDLCSQDSQCDPTADSHSNICSQLHMCDLLCMFGESVFALIPDHEVRAAKLTNRLISGCSWRRDASSDEHLVGTTQTLLKCRSVRRKPPG